MMTEISLNILDVAENSVKAGASLTEIAVTANVKANALTVTIRDNGCGMTPEQVNRVTDPFYTTRTTRKVGLGVPFFKEAAEQTGGSFCITSAPGVGTTVTAVFVLNSIDRMPLGDICATLHTLITMHPEQDFLFTYRVNENFFTLDTRQFKEILEGVALNTPEVSAYLRDYLRENTAEVTGELIL